MNGVCPARVQPRPGTHYTAFLPATGSAKMRRGKRRFVAEQRAGGPGETSRIAEDKPIGSVEVQSIKSKAAITSGEVRAPKRGPRAMGQNNLRQEMKRP
jgi:hypothetical protein